MSIVRNAGYNLAASIVPIVLSLVILPLYIHAIGEARYGMVALIGALVGFFGVFDLGLSVAAAQRMAAAPEGDLDARRRIFWTAGAINAAMGVAGGLIILPVAWFYVGKGLNVGPDLLPEIKASIWWLALALPVALLTGVLRGALQGSGRFAELNLINIVVGSTSQFMPLLAAWWISPSLTVVLPALYLTRVLTMACYAWVIARRVLDSWLPHFDRSRVKDLLSFGGWVTISGLLSPLMSSLDRYFIGSFAGLKAVSYYSVPYQLAERTTILPTALVSALFPRVAAAHSDEAHRLGVRGLRAIAAVMGPLMVGGIVVLHPLLKLWIGAAFAGESALCGQILLMGFWWNALGMGCYVWLHAVGRVRLVTVAHAIEAVPYFIALVLGLKLFGLPGAAAAFALRVGADAVLLGRFAGLGGEVVRLSALGAIAFAAAQWASLPLAGYGWGDAALGLIPIAGVSLLSLAWLWGERGALLALVRR